MAASNTIRWLPLESNPETINSFLQKMGVKNSYAFVDILGFDSELLALVPQPVIAVLLLFPCSELNEEKLRASHSDDCSTCDTSDKKPYFIVQTIRNACGTIALIHAIANNTDTLQFEENSVLMDFIRKTADLKPEDRSKELEKDSNIGVAHEHCAQEGQTAAPDLNQSIDFHFIALIEHDNRIYELDGRKSAPICHGKTSKETFLNDAGNVCKRFFDSCSNSYNFTAIALAKQEP
ncbi:ubiquitin carboxyl-terminal hydrolase isozyme L3-like isoform X2 [Leptotrombidium deliense]|uniref:Ubiquitin carboxyl-terminal hydrolase n=1 Tax=Leptotrombidium deliense TaxID=299467 RepID=A0A443SH82_9ACAR|nr:ubiquitin carboxyl-terminal hydrolase isozyme L3-like isoform X2 [Leptotrombidium deliense]